MAKGDAKIRAALKSLVPVSYTISGSYGKDFNIKNTNRTIRQWLSADAEPNSALLRKLHGLLASLQNKLDLPQSIIGIRKVTEEIKHVEAQIHYVASGSRLTDYQEETEELVEAYSKLGTKARTISFGQTEADFLTPEDQTRLNIITAYLEKASEFYPIDVIWEAPQIVTCANCSRNLSELSIEDDGLQACPCGVRRYLPRIKESNENPNFHKSGSPALVNLMKAYDRYQGIPAIDFPDEAVLRLDAYFAGRQLSNGKKFPTKEDVWEMPLRRRCRGPTNHAMLREALAATELSGYYEDVNAIGNIYWKWQLPQVNHLREAFVRNHNKMYPHYLALEKDRKSSIGTQYELFKGLELLGYDCRREEFKIPQDSLEDMERFWEEMCEKVDDPNIYFIATPK